ncbi:MAG: 50S ribosomal protein L21 [Candidatus Roizmanbacteria bacterium GW2011_GWA2_35_19]|uniref:Large ribosomal subunit protein bL21 n=1 Tax=Candidatus Roizmanbacteria bacterium GW2011_GWA2_35_19 TaxID=1618478 RepID=A0A0G0F348_9BACT|nr:MAG: 50S ribosomal protein L21 [Candidatus Roizmanbacteria bacterium GW2011_GWA2_35_19]
MVTFAVVKTGGQQFLVKENDVITVSKLEKKEKEKIELETLAIFDDEGKSIEIGTPYLTKKVSVEIIAQGKGLKIRVARFKAKSRYRKVTGFRPQLTSLKILKI